jgi:hypothetical protein
MSKNTLVKKCRRSVKILAVLPHFIASAEVDHNNGIIETGKLSKEWHITID